MFVLLWTNSYSAGSPSSDIQDIKDNLGQVTFRKFVMILFLRR